MLCSSLSVTQHIHESVSDARFGEWESENRGSKTPVISSLSTLRAPSVARMCILTSAGRATLGGVFVVIVVTGGRGRELDFVEMHQR